jgi:DNA-binding MarR family transcriptional regulator
LKWQTLLSKSVSNAKAQKIVSLYRRRQVNLNKGRTQRATLSPRLDNKCLNTYIKEVEGNKAVRSLQADLKMARPFKTVEQELLLNIVRTAAVLEHDLAEKLKPFGLTPTQYNVLRILRGTPEGLCRNAVGERLVTRVPDVTRLLDRMERMGLIQRNRSGEDRRFVTTSITDKGLKLVDKLDRDICTIHARQLGHLGEKKARDLIKLLTEARAEL